MSSFSTEPSAFLASRAWKSFESTIFEPPKSLEAKDAQGNVTKLNMPDTSNVLQWFCEDGTKVSVRPSGTEPKIKFYTEVKDPSFKGAADYESCSKAADAKIEALKKDLNL